MKCLNGFPEGKLHKRLDPGGVWEVRGREMVSGRQKGEGTHRSGSRQGVTGNTTAVLKAKLCDGNFIPPRMQEDLVKQRGGF